MSLDLNRSKRYKDKISLAEKRLDEIDDWKSDFHKDDKSKLACYKALQEIIESYMDILAMRITDAKEIPKDDYTNIDFAFEKEIIDLKIRNALKEANGLRNRLVHEYNGLNDELAFKSMIKLLPDIEKFLENINTWLKNGINK